MAPHRNVLLRVLLTILLALLVLLESSGASALSLTRGPYLQRPADDTTLIVFDTDVPVAGGLRYRPDGGSWSLQTESSAGTQHSFALAGLSAGSLYDYQIFGGAQPLSTVSRFRANRSSDDDEIFFGVAGDTSGGSVPAAIASQLSSLGVDLALHVGDLAYPNGTLQELDSGFFGPMASLLSRAPVLPILGDHDVRADDGASFFQVFSLPPNGVEAPPRYYSFRQGPAEFFCLDVESSDYGEDSPQYRWLETRLAQSSARWKFVTVFEPPFSSENSNVIERLILSPLFEMYGVDIVFSGHEHLYERTKPLRLFDPTGSPVIYVTEGGGGAVLSSFEKQDFSGFVEAAYGFVTVEIHGGSLRLEARTPDGTLLDSLSLGKALPTDGRQDVSQDLSTGPTAPPPATVLSGRP
jgi:hypothetical protein